MRLTYVDVLCVQRLWIYDRQADKCPCQLSFHWRHRYVGARRALEVLHLFGRERVIENHDATIGGTGVVRWDRGEGSHWCKEVSSDRDRQIEKESQNE